LKAIDGQRRPPARRASSNRWSRRKKKSLLLAKLAAFVLAKDFGQLRINEQTIPRPPEAKGQERKGWILEARALKKV